MREPKDDLTAKDELLFGLAGAVTLPAVGGYILLVTMQVPTTPPEWKLVLVGTCIFFLFVWVFALRLIWLAVRKLISKSSVHSHIRRPS